MEQALVLGFALGFAGTSTLIWMGFLLAGFVRIPAGQVLAITRSGQPDGRPVAFFRGGRALVIPFFQRGTLYPTRPIPVSLAGQEIARAGVPGLVCALEAEVLPEKDDDGLARYVKVFGGHEPDGIAAIVVRVVRNGARQVLGALPQDQVLADGAWAAGHLRDHLCQELEPLGLTLVKLHLEVRPAPKSASSPVSSEFSMDGFKAG